MIGSTTYGKRVLQLPVESIIPNPAQPRRIFEAEGLEELASSIRQHGILQPLTVRRREDGEYELVAGERRLRAAKLAGLRRVPCLQVKMDETESAMLALVENLQRRDLHFLEEAAAIASFLRKTGFSQDEIAKRLGRSPSAVANKLRLLRLSPACCEQLMVHGLSERHARALLRLEDESDRQAALTHIIRRSLNVAQTDQYISRCLEKQQTTPPSRRPTYIVKDVRLFLNSIERGMHVMQAAGVNSICDRKDTDSEILLTIHIPRHKTG